MTRAHYVRTIRDLTASAREELIARGTPSSAVDFDAEHHRGRTPGDARSEFLANRAMGDWAEERFAAAFDDLELEYVAAPYGETDRIVAGDPDFRGYYDEYQTSLAEIGKRPDRLVVSRELSSKIETRDEADRDVLASEALAAVEQTSFSPQIKDHFRSASRTHTTCPCN